MTLRGYQLVMDAFQLKYKSSTDHAVRLNKVSLIMHILTIVFVASVDCTDFTEYIGRRKEMLQSRP
jgi:hypothetical protein